MSGFPVVLAKLKRWLGHGRSQQLRSRTYAGSFEAQRNADGRPAGFDDYLKYAESNADVRLVASDVVRITDGKQLKHEIIDEPDGIGAFHQTIAVCCLDFARYVVVLRNQMK